MDPELADVRRRLRNDLIDWLIRVGDTSVYPESELRASLLEQGAIPRTPAPRVRLEAGRLIVDAVPGASVGYRLMATDDGTAEDRWRLYTGPVPIVSGVTVKAVLYGWRESPEVERSR